MPGIKKPKYYINYKFFAGDEHSGESVVSGTIIEANNDIDAVHEITKRVTKERDGEMTAIFTVQNVSGLFDLLSDSIDTEHNSDDFTSTQKFNICFNLAHYLYGKKI